MVPKNQMGNVGSFNFKREEMLYQIETNRLMEEQQFIKDPYEWNWPSRFL